MRKILSIILAISILCTMAITPVMAEDVALDEVTETEKVTPEDNTSTEDTTPEEGEGSEEVTPPEEEVQETSFKVLYTLPSLRNGDPEQFAQSLIATNQETIKVVFSNEIASGVEPAGDVYVTAEGNTATVKFGELKLDTEYTLTVPATLTDIEDECDKIYLSSMRELMKSSKDVLVAISWREIFDCFESCADICENVSENIGSVIMKNT